jgi:hypothetical protein
MKPEPNRLIFLDAETFYDSASDYTLKKMTPVEYILDNRFELILMAVKEGVSGKGYVVDGPDFPRWVKDAEPTRALTATVNWNALFDASICGWRYGYVPGRMLDAMTMARAIIGHELPGLSLDAVSKYFKLPPKGDMVQKVDGLHRADIIARGMWEHECAYAMHDNDLCAAIWQILSPKFPWAEQRLQDLVIRCTVEPQLYLDKRRLYDYYTRTRADKDRLLRTAGGIAREELTSAVKFTKLLESKGILVQQKISKTTGKPTPALARTDTFMQSLVHHDDAEIAALAAARLGHKSTLEETRCKRLLQISMLQNWPMIYTRPCSPMPVPLRYAGAHTHRLSGDWGLNEQNMKRGSELRYSHVVPADHEAIVADLGQIECRINAWICGEVGLLRTFANKGDPYNELATAIFGRPVFRKKPEDFVEGFIGKTGTLGLGFGCGAERFYGMVLELSYILGIKLGSRWTPALAEKSVQIYRRMHPNIHDTWQRLNNIVASVWYRGSGFEGPYKFGPVTIEYGCILGPNGLEMRYHNPSQEVGGEFFYTYGKVYRDEDGNITNVHRMYGAKMLENIVQFLARIVVMNAALRLADRGYRFALQAHDELVFVVHKSDVDKAKKIIHEEMTRPPSWAKDLPLTVGIGVGRSYGEAGDAK